MDMADCIIRGGIFAMRQAHQKIIYVRQRTKRRRQKWDKYNQCDELP